MKKLTGNKMNSKIYRHHSGYIGGMKETPANVMLEKNPEKVKKLKNFFDYYLPVTVKLVDRYDEIENQKINSEEEKNFNTTTEKTIKEWLAETH